MCTPGTYNDQDAGSCRNCHVAMVALSHGHLQCDYCKPGQAYASSVRCDDCMPGFYNDDKLNQGGCKRCPMNTYSQSSKPLKSK